MNNEPVAWTDGKGNYFDKNSFFPVDDLIPLYTHPAETITLAELRQTELYRKEQTRHLRELLEPIPFAGLVRLQDKEDREQYLRDQIHIIQAECQRLRKKLKEHGCND